LAGTDPSRRRLITIVTLLVVLAGAFIIVRPRLWVKNKTAKVIFDGKLSEDVKLYHGSDDRLLFFLKDDSDGAYYYDFTTGISRCNKSEVVSAKLIVFSPKSRPACLERLGAGNRESQSLEFHQRGRQVIVSWQAAPR